VDPTPGDAFGIRALAQKYADIAQIAGEASTGVHAPAPIHSGLASSTFVLSKPGCAVWPVKPTSLDAASIRFPPTYVLPEKARNAT